MAKGTEDWAGHLAAIEAEGISTKAYAEREGVSAAALYWWRRRLKARQATGVRPVRSGGFVPVQVREIGEPMPCRMVIGAGATLELSRLPSPQWIAALLAAVGERGR
jgi:hypothetical protein